MFERMLIAIVVMGALLLLQLVRNRQRTTKFLVPRIKIDEISWVPLPASDMAFIDYANRQRDRIIQSLGIPPLLVSPHELCPLVSVPSNPDCVIRPKLSDADVKKLSDMLDKSCRGPRKEKHEH